MIDGNSLFGLSVIIIFSGSRATSMREVASCRQHHQVQGGQARQFIDDANAPGVDVAPDDEGWHCDDLMPQEWMWPLMTKGGTAMC